jgi:hypothetical protein
VVTADDVWAAPMTAGGAVRTFATNADTRERGDVMHRYRARRGRHLAVAALAITAIGLTACGDDDDAAPAAAAAAPTTTAAHSGTHTPSGGGDLAAYCDAEVEVETAAAALGDPDEDPKAFAAALVAPVQAAAAIAPDEVKDLHAKRMELLQTAAQEGDGEAIQQADQPGIHDFDKANCGWTRIDVEAAEYHFTGLPETMKAGVYDFELKNVGQEFHVLAIVARKPGVTASFDELLADPDAESKVVDVVGTGADPGETGSAVGRLEPGEYLAVCPIPQGSVGETPGSGPPHFTQGMRQVITVTA